VSKQKKMNVAPVNKVEPQENKQALGQFLSRMFNGQEIQQRASDGFVNGTAMAKAGGKNMKEYTRSKRANNYKSALKSILPNDMKVHTPALFAFVMFVHYCLYNNYNLI